MTNEPAFSSPKGSAQCHPEPREKAKDLSIGLVPSSLGDLLLDREIPLPRLRDRDDIARRKGNYLQAAPGLAGLRSKGS